MTDPLKPLREKIDALDAQILALLSERAHVALEVGEVKKATNAPVFRPEREAQVIANLAQNNPGPLPDDALAIIYREIMSACRALERRVVVAYLGPEGTYCELALRRQFGTSVNAVPCANIDEIFRIVEACGADFGVIPVENSTEGAINRSLDLLLHTPLQICGDVTLAIHHHLLTASGGMDGVARICAHPQALAQCAGWLATHYPGVERTPVSSNGEAARMAAADPTVAAIAGESAAQRYNLNAVASNIQDEARNMTRFAVIGSVETQPSGNDHTSIVVSVPNEAGAVYKLLAPLAQHSVSMTRFESRPARTGDWVYLFYIDIEGHKQDAKVARALVELQELAGFFKILGSYPLTQ